MIIKIFTLFFPGVVIEIFLVKLQEEEIKEKASKLEQAEQRLTTLNLELKVSVCYFKLFHCLSAPELYPENIF